MQEHYIAIYGSLSIYSHLYLVMDKKANSQKNYKNNNVHQNTLVTIVPTVKQ